MKKYPLIIGNEEVFTEDTHIVYNKYTGEPYAQISLAGPEQVEAAASAAYEAFRSVPFDALARYNVLMKASQLLSERADDLAMTMVAEAGKTLQDAKMRCSGPWTC